MRKLTGILLLTAALFIGYVSAAALYVPDDTIGAASGALWLGDDQYDPANEGKLVVIIVDPEKFENAVDTDLNIPFDVPAVKRQVSIFIHRMKENYAWVNAEEAGGFRTEIFLGRNKDPNALQLDPAYGPMLPALGDDYGTLELDHARLRAYGLRDFYVLGRKYLTTASPEAFEEPVDRSDNDENTYYEDEGKIRMYYRQRWTGGNPLAIMGIQRGQTLVPDEQTRAYAVSENTDSLEAMIGQERDMIVLGAGFGLAGAAALLIWGLHKLGVFRIGKHCRAKAPGEKEPGDSAESR